LKYQDFATSSSHILIPFITGNSAGWGMDTKILLQRFLVGMRDHFGDAERGISMYKVFLNALVAISWHLARRRLKQGSFVTALLRGCVSLLFSACCMPPSRPRPPYQARIPGRENVSQLHA